MAARIRLPRASCGDRRQAELAGVADHIAGMLAGDRNQRIHGGIAILGLDDHAVHDQIVHTRPGRFSLAQGLLAAFGALGSN